MFRIFDLLGSYWRKLTEPKSLKLAFKCLGYRPPAIGIQILRILGCTLETSCHLIAKNGERWGKSNETTLRTNPPL